MKEELQKLLKEQFGIEIWYSVLDIDCTHIYFVKDKYVGYKIIELLSSLGIVVYSVPNSYDKIYDDEVTIISTEILK